MSVKQVSQAVYRQSDHELMGKVVLDADDLWVACTNFGYPLTRAMSKSDAIHFLEDHGLELLLDGWQLNDDGDWYNCAIIEATSQKLTVRISDYGHPDVHQTRVITDLSERSIRRR